MPFTLSQATACKCFAIVGSRPALYFGANGEAVNAWLKSNSLPSGAGAWLVSYPVSYRQSSGVAARRHALFRRLGCGRKDLLGGY